MNLSQTKKIGFIGLGAMGRGLAGNLLRAGYPMTVWDVAPDASKEFSERGAVIADNPKSLASQVDVLFSMVPDAPDVRSIALGKNGIIESGNDKLIYVDFSTIDPQTSGEVAKALATVGIRMLDSPVGRGVPDAQAGTVTFMVGGASEDLEDVRPLLEVMSSEIMHIGPQSSGAAIKLVNNYLASGLVAVIAEAAALGIKSGLTLEQIIGLSDKTGTSNKVLNTVLPSKAFLADYTPGFASRLAAKDQRLAMKLGSDLGVELPVGSVVHTILEACERAHPDDDFMGSIMRLVEDQSGSNIRLKS